MADIRPIAPSIPPRRRRSYARPTLIKGPVLASVTAVKGGGAVSGVAPPPPACWVARAAFGEADIRWMIFQAWLIEDAPAWIRAGYLRYGEAVGAWLVGHELARAVVRAAMMLPIRRKVLG